MDRVHLWPFELLIVSRPGYVPWVLARKARNECKASGKTPLWHFTTSHATINNAKPTHRPLPRQNDDITDIPQKSSEIVPPWRSRHGTSIHGLLPDCWMGPTQPNSVTIL